MIKAITIIGARPQFIKAAVLSRAIKNEDSISEDILHTGQHFDENMSDVFFDELAIPKPKYFLNIQGGNHGQMTGRMLEGIENILLTSKPDVVIVYGDTNSTLAGALAAAKLNIPVAHIESGLRSYNREMPEEINRILTDQISSMLFCPTTSAVSNLQKEGIFNNVYNVGDVMYDATLYAINNLPNLQLDIGISLPQNFAFMTIHRAHSTNSLESFMQIIDYAKQFSLKHDLKIVYPAHPRTKELISKLDPKYISDFIIIDPISYFTAQYCLTKAKYVLTDSGGLQKEAYFHKVPCVTLRSETEWVETIENGWNRLWFDPEYKPKVNINEYGDGNSAKHILQIIKDYFK